MRLQCVDEFLERFWLIITDAGDEDLPHRYLHTPHHGRSLFRFEGRHGLFQRVEPGQHFSFTRGAFSPATTPKPHDALARVTVEVSAHSSRHSTTRYGQKFNWCRHGTPLCVGQPSPTVMLSLLVPVT